MSNYPPYSYQQPQMMGYQQNFNQNMQMQNPYMDRLAQMQQFQQNQQMQPTQMPGAPPQMQQPGIVGKIVNDFSELTANDVPMNGQAAFFPKADGSEMQVRSWTANGTIQTVVYKPVLDQNQAEGTNIPKMDFNALNEDVRALRGEMAERFDRLEKSWADFELMRHQKPVSGQGQRNNAKPKKPEVGADE